MMRALLALVVGLALFACSDGERSPDQWPLSRDELGGERAEAHPGEPVYRRYCVGCHGTDGRGHGGVTGADFTAANGPLKSRSDAELVASVRDGKRGEGASMPAHSPVLSPAQIEAVVRYVRERFGSESGAQAAP